jgi:hypothetical protein
MAYDTALIKNAVKVLIEVGYIYQNYIPYDDATTASPESAEDLEIMISGWVEKGELRSHEKYEITHIDLNPDEMKVAVRIACKAVWDIWCSEMDS